MPEDGSRNFRNVAQPKPTWFKNRLHSSSYYKYISPGLYFWIVSHIHFYDIPNIWQWPWCSQNHCTFLKLVFHLRINSHKSTFLCINRIGFSIITVQSKAHETKKKFNSCEIIRKWKTGLRQTGLVFFILKCEACLHRFKLLILFLYNTVSHMHYTAFDTENIKVEEKTTPADENEEKTKYRMIDLLFPSLKVRGSRKTFPSLMNLTSGKKMTRFFFLGQSPLYSLFNMCLWRYQFFFSCHNKGITPYLMSC